MTNIEAYEEQIADSRLSFQKHPAVHTVCEAEVAPRIIEAFLIYFNALGVGMTEPVGGWIRRAGERCGELGLSSLARALCLHAQHEDGHHLLMQSDTRELVNRWNQRHEPKLNADELLTIEPTMGVTTYRSLHEEVITGNSPYGQLAIEYEIEMLSIAYGPQLIGRSMRMIGQDVLQDMSFLRDHVELDAGHTKFNRRQLSELLEEHPEFLHGLVSAGSRALGAYAMFLGDCVTLAQTVAN
jgi:hypothetical protein